MEYDKKNSFVLFQNEKKSEKAPDYRGTLTDENGKEWDIAVWERTSKKGTPFLSGKVSEPYQKPEGGSWAQAREKFAKPDVVLNDIDDDIDVNSIPF